MQTAFLTFLQGSGKTLAFGIPVLHRLLELKKNFSERGKSFLPNHRFWLSKNCPGVLRTISVRFLTRIVAVVLFVVQLDGDTCLFQKKKKKKKEREREK